MKPAITLWVIMFGVWAVLAAILIAAAGRVEMPTGLRRLGRRLGAAGDGAIEQLGRPAVVLIAVLAWEALMVIVFFGLGKFAKALEPHVDEPVFAWFQARQIPWWSDIWWKITNIGSPTVTQTIVVIGSVVLAVVWRRQCWWLPAATLVIGYLMEKYGQMCIQTIVHRGHPPTTHGTWPSGGMARIWVVYGLVVFLTLIGFQVRNRRIWAAGLSLVLLFETIQAYSRNYNLEHWVTDVIGGFLFGIFLVTGGLGVQWLLRRGGTAPVVPSSIERETSRSAV